MPKVTTFGPSGAILNTVNVEKKDATPEDISKLLSSMKLPAGVSFQITYEGSANRFASSHRSQLSTSFNVIDDPVEGKKDPAPTKLPQSNPFVLSTDKFFSNGAADATATKSERADSSELASDFDVVDPLVPDADSPVLPSTPESEPSATAPVAPVNALRGNLFGLEFLYPAAAGEKSSSVGAKGTAKEPTVKAAAVSKPPPPPPAPVVPLNGATRLSQAQSASAIAKEVPSTVAVAPSTLRVSCQKPAPASASMDSADAAASDLADAYLSKLYRKVGYTRPTASKDDHSAGSSRGSLWSAGVSPSVQRSGVANRGSKDDVRSAGAESESNGARFLGLGEREEPSTTADHLKTRWTSSATPIAVAAASAAAAAFERGAAAAAASARSSGSDLPRPSLSLSLRRPLSVSPSCSTLTTPSLTPPKVAVGTSTQDPYITLGVATHASCGTNTSLAPLNCQQTQTSPRYMPLYTARRSHAELLSAPFSPSTTPITPPPSLPTALLMSFTDLRAVRNRSSPCPSSSAATEESLLVSASTRRPLTPLTVRLSSSESTCQSSVWPTSGLMPLSLPGMRRTSSLSSFARSAEVCDTPSPASLAPIEEGTRKTAPPPPSPPRRSIPQDLSPYVAAPCTDSNVFYSPRADLLPSPAVQSAQRKAMAALSVRLAPSRPHTPPRVRAYPRLQLSPLTIHPSPPSRPTVLHDSSRLLATSRVTTPSFILSSGSPLCESPTAVADLNLTLPPLSRGVEDVIVSPFPASASIPLCSMVASPPSASKRRKLSVTFADSPTMIITPTTITRDAATTPASPIDSPLPAGIASTTIGATISTSSISHRGVTTAAHKHPRALLDGLCADGRTRWTKRGAALLCGGCRGAMECDAVGKSVDGNSAVHTVRLMAVLCSGVLLGLLMVLLSFQFLMGSLDM